MDRLDEQDFVAVYEEHVWRVYAFLAYRVQSRADAEDLTQLTFERAFRAWHTFDSRRAEPQTWLLAIARNAYVDFRRRKPRPSGDALELWKEGRHEPGPEADSLIEPELAHAVRRLGRRERDALGLRFWADLKIADIAEVMGISHANAQQILSRALRKLRDDLDAPRGREGTSRAARRR